MLAPLRYNVIDAAPLRGCAVCDYGRDLGSTPENHGVLCRHPDVARLPRLAPTESARAFGGACGKDAKFLTINGVEL